MNKRGQLLAIVFVMGVTAAVASDGVANDSWTLPAASPYLDLPGSTGIRRTTDAAGNTIAVPCRLPPILDAEQGPSFASGALGGTVPRWHDNGKPSHRFMAERLSPPVAPCEIWRPNLLRIGWWGTTWDGSPAKIGEWQDLRSSPAFDVDVLHSNGRHTTNLILGGTDQETNVLDLYHYRPALTAELDYDRFVHRRGRDPLNNFTDVRDPAVAPDAMVKDDLNAGPDYVVRVQELKASLKKRLTENLRVRLDVWGMRRSGTRQANAMADCFHPAGFANPADGRCHILTQPQRIDWITMEVKPVVEWKRGPLAVEYSRPMRGFQQSDQLVTRPYGPRRVPTFVFDGMFALRPDVDYAYGVTPENFTQIDQVKLGWEVNEHNKIYSFLYYGNTENKQIDLARSFGGVDVRLTNRTFNNLTLTPYFKFYAENTSVPDEQHIGLMIPENGIAIPGEAEPAIAGLRLISRKHSKAGLRGVWRPRGGGFGRRGLSLSGGYQYYDLDRRYADFDPGFNADSTITHQFWLRPKIRWSPHLESFLRYKMRLVERPLFGTRVIADAAGGPALPYANTLLPEQDNLAEIGGTWTPTQRFLVTATIGFEQRYHSPIELGPTVPFSGGHFLENVFPLTCSAWYQVSDKWSLTAGAAYFSDSINQDVMLGEDYVVDPAAPGTYLRPLNSQWTYTGRAEVYNLGSRYAVGETIWLTGNVEIVNGLNSLTTATFSDIPSFSAVNVNTTRLNVGFDWLPNDRVSTYFRYILYRYDDETSVFNSGTSHMFLCGFSAAL